MIFEPIEVEVENINFFLKKPEKKEEEQTGILLT